MVHSIYSLKQGEFRSIARNWEPLHSLGFHDNNLFGRVTQSCCQEQITKSDQPHLYPSSHLHILQYYSFHIFACFTIATNISGVFCIVLYLVKGIRH